MGALICGRFSISHAVVNSIPSCEVTFVGHRKTHPQPIIIDAVIERKSAEWNESTRAVARTDAQRVLEALVAEYGVDEAVRALNNQGFTGEACRYLLNPIYEEALARRALLTNNSNQGSAKLSKPSSSRELGHKEVDGCELTRSTAFLASRKR